MLLAIIVVLVQLFFIELYGQINLGTFDLRRNPLGDLQLALGQGGSLFGFGGDRALRVTVGPEKALLADSGVVLGGERVGVDSQLGVREGQGLNLGSMLNFGNNGGVDPLSSLLRNIGSFLRPPSNGMGALPRIGPPTTFSRPNPTLIPPMGGGKWSGGEDEEDRWPMGVGSGWDGDETCTENSRGSETDPFTKSSEVGERETVPNVKRITTEGQRRGETGNTNEKVGKHDGGTGEEFTRGKLPVPDGLEMISNNSKELRRH